MTSEYSSIFSRFLMRVEDYKIANLDENTANEILIGYLRNTASDSFVRKLFTTFIMDDNTEEIEWVLANPQEDLADTDFVEDILSEGMIVQWVQPRYHSTLLTSQFFSNKEQNFYSQANHMAELKAMYDTARNDIRKKIRDRGYQYATAE